MTNYKTLVAGIVGGLLSVSAQATVLTQDGFSIDAEGDTWNEVTLNGVEIDTSSYFQGFYLNGDELALEEAVSSGPSILATSALHSGTVGDFFITVTSSITGVSGNTANFQTVLTITNNGVAPVDGIELISNVDGDLNDTTSDGDTVFYDGGAGQIVQFDGPVFLRGSASGPGTAGRELSICCDIPTFPLPNNDGPIGPDDVQFNLGFLFGLGAGETGTFAFDYVFQADAVPAPASLALFGLGALGLGLTRRRR